MIRTLVQVITNNNDKIRVVEEMSYGDVSDCVIYLNTGNEKKVDFKTAWKPFHTRILVPEDMFLSQVKDIYIGVKIDLEQLKAEVYGYISRRDLATLHPIQDFHIGDAYWAYLSELEPLEDLKL